MLRLFSKGASRWSWNGNVRPLKKREAPPKGLALWLSLLSSSSSSSSFTNRTQLQARRRRQGQERYWCQVQFSLCVTQQGGTSGHLPFFFLQPTTLFCCLSSWTQLYRKLRIIKWCRFSNSQCETRNSRWIVSSCNFVCLLYHFFYTQVLSCWFYLFNWLNEDRYTFSMQLFMVYNTEKSSFFTFTFTRTRLCLLSFSFLKTVLLLFVHFS